MKQEPPRSEFAAEAPTAISTPRARRANADTIVPSSTTRNQGSNK